MDRPTRARESPRYFCDPEKEYFNETLESGLFCNNMACGGNVMHVTLCDMTKNCIGM